MMARRASQSSPRFRRAVTQPSTVPLMKSFPEDQASFAGQCLIGRVLFDQLIRYFVCPANVNAGAKMHRLAGILRIEWGKIGWRLRLAHRASRSRRSGLLQENGRRLVGFQSRASFCASAICASVIRCDTVSRTCIASL